MGAEGAPGAPGAEVMASVEEKRGRGPGFSFVISSLRFTSSWDRPGRRAKGSGQRTGNPDKMYAAIV